MSEIVKVCPQCARRLVRDWDEKGKTVLVCEGRFWRLCAHQEPLPVDLTLRSANAPLLPGLE